MKNTSILMQCIAMLCTLSITACGPIQTRSHVLPTNLSGQECVQQCQQQERSCNATRCLQDNSCTSSQTLEMDLERLRDPSGRLASINHGTATYDQSECSARYEDCFTGCGGTVEYTSQNKHPARLFLYATLAVALAYLNHANTN